MMNNSIALPIKLSDVIEEYQKKFAAMPASVKAFNEAQDTLQSACSVAGTYVGGITRAYNYESDLKKMLLKSAWKKTYDGLKIDSIATAKERKLFEMQLQNPPEFTLENIFATFKDYVTNPRDSILKGLAECFCDLDPAYKSHRKVAIGVEGLPKRVILTDVCDYTWNCTPEYHGKQKVYDVFRALCLYRGTEVPDIQKITEYIQDAMDNKICDTPQGITIKAFKNGNAHLIFDKFALVDINKGLAEYYGDVLPDVEGERPTKKQESTAVSKDLQFYRTPKKVMDEIFKREYFDPKYSYEILEPSCGDGAIMNYVRENLTKSYIQGIEYNIDRAETARKSGHVVTIGNFLEIPATPKFDIILMNPPFYGTHWKKHIRHALNFLAPEGKLVAILPASAYYDGHLNEWIAGCGTWSRPWKDLPIGSFSESGTNVNTGFVVLHKD